MGPRTGHVIRSDSAIELFHSASLKSKAVSQLCNVFIRLREAQLAKCIDVAATESLLVIGFASLDVQRTHFGVASLDCAVLNRGRMFYGVERGTD